MLHEFGGSLTENTQSKSNLEAELLKIEIDKDSHKDGPMAQIVQLELEILNDEQSNSRFIHFIKTGDPQTLGERKFAFQGKDYWLKVTIANDGDDMAIRISIITSDGGNFSSGSKNRQLQLRNNEVSFRQYNFFDFNGVTYLVGSLASANICPTGFAKSLILSTSLVARLIMKKLSIPVLQASIGDDSVTHNGSLGWTEQMARRLGYEQSTDYSNLFVYTYD